MNYQQTRRSFIKTTSLAAGGIGALGPVHILRSAAMIIVRYWSGKISMRLFSDVLPINEYRLPLREVAEVGCRQRYLCAGRR